MATFSASYPPIHDSQGTQTNPGIATVLADTGAVASRLYDVKVLVGCSVAAILAVQVRDSANATTNQDEVIIRAAAGQTGEYVFKFALNTNERVRVLPKVAITGDAEATVQLVAVT